MKRITSGWTLCPLAMVLLCGPVYASRTQEAASAATQSTDTPPGPPADGEHHGPPRGGPEHRLTMLQHELSLSAAQTAQVKTILQGERTRAEALRNSGGATTPDERHAEMQSVRQSTNSSIRAVLTADQAAKFDAMEARMRAHRQGPGGPPPPPDGAAPQSPQ